MNSLMQEVADEHGLEVGVELGGHSVPGKGITKSTLLFKISVCFYTLCSISYIL